MSLNNKYILAIFFIWLSVTVTLIMRHSNVLRRAIFQWAVLSVLISNLIICAFCNLYVYLKIRWEQKKICNNNAHQISAQVLQRKNKKTAKTVLIITLCYYVCFLPEFLATLTRILSKKDTDIVYQSKTWAAVFFYLNSSLNPCIFSLRLEKIRNKLKENVRNFKKRILSCISNED